MNETFKIDQYLKRHSRNKIVFYKQDIPGVEALDVGKNLSKEIQGFVSDTKIGMKSIIILEELFASAVFEHPNYGSYLAIQNVALLLEPEIKIDFVKLLEKYSSTNALFVKWEGEIEDGILYFLTKEKGKRIDIKNLSHIAI